MSIRYNFKRSEPKWQAIWEKHGLLPAAIPGSLVSNVQQKISLNSAPMLHMGHFRLYTLNDVIARYYQAHPLKTADTPKFFISFSNDITLPRTSEDEQGYKEALRYQLRVMGVMYGWAEDQSCNIEPNKKGALIRCGSICHETYRDGQGQWLYPEQVKKGNGGILISTIDKTSVTVGHPRRMSENWKNTIKALEVIQEYGADTVRLFMVSDTPPDRGIEWNETALEGCWRYLHRLWQGIQTVLPKTVGSASSLGGSELPSAALALRCLVHTTIMEYTQDLKNLHFHKGVARLRALTNALLHFRGAEQAEREVLKEGYETLVRLLAPIVPHFAEEAWECLGYSNDILALKEWPIAQDSIPVREDVMIRVHVNGVLRGSLNLPKGTEQQIIERQALALCPVKRDIQHRVIRKVVYVQDRVVNFVV